MKKYYYIAIMIGLISSCKIDRTPYDSLTVADLNTSAGSLQAVTNGNYAAFKTMSLGWYRVMEYGSDNVSLSGTTTSHLFYLYNYQRIEANSFTTSFWTTSYQIIVSCNKMIEQVAEAKSAATDQLLGENYFLRAYLHFALVTVFGRPYAQDPTALGVPIKIDSDPKNIPGRAKVQDVYQQVIKDLQKAAQLMTVSKTNAYASKEVAWALLSRVYLYMGNNASAIDYANKVIDSKRYALLPMASFGVYPTLKPENNSETIFAIKFVLNSDLLGGGYNNIGSEYSTIQGVGYGEIYAAKPYLDLLRKYPSDVRNSFISPVYLNSGKITGIYVDDNYNFKTFYVTKVNTDDYSYTDNGTTKLLDKQSNPDGSTSYFINLSPTSRKPVTIEPEMANRNGYPKWYIIKCSNQEGQSQLWSPVVLRLAEMYLNRAEANAKLGNTGPAIADVNLIRTRAGIPATGLYDANNLPAGRTALDIVLEEDRLEFAYEGHRKFDLFRNKLDLDRRYPGVHLAGNNPINYVKWTDNDIIEFIPQSQILVQPGLTQNP